MAEALLVRFSFPSTQNRLHSRPSGFLTCYSLCAPSCLRASQLLNTKLPKISTKSNDQNSLLSKWDKQKCVLITCRLMRQKTKINKCVWARPSSPPPTQFVNFCHLIPFLMKASLTSLLLNINYSTAERLRMPVLELL